jgi:hypothetical protein
MTTPCRVAVVGATGIAGQPFVGAAAGAVLVAEWLKATGHLDGAGGGSSAGRARSR